MYSLDALINQTWFIALMAVTSQAQTLIDGVPEWIECTIYRKDRKLPICVREYFSEVKGASIIWQKMPNRMLRHRALQQCVRLAL